MPLSYAVSQKEKLVRVSATGAVHSDDIPRFTASLVGDGGIGKGMRFLVEANEVEPDLTFTDLRNAAGALRDLKVKGVDTMAIVTDTTHIYALAQVFAVFAPAATVKVKVFREIADALKWLRNPLESTAS
jgi:hypothetical protein